MNRKEWLTDSLIGAVRLNHSMYHRFKSEMIESEFYNNQLALCIALEKC